jgi:hypothetical protein
VLVEEPLIVGLEEQIQVLADRQVQVGTLRTPGTVYTRSGLVHEDQKEQYHCRREDLSVSTELAIERIERGMEMYRTLLAVLITKYTNNHEWL